MLVLEEDAEPQRMGGAEPPARVGLHSGREARQPRGVGETVEDDVAVIGIGREPRLRVADERRDLKVQRVARILIGSHRIMGDFALVLVELGGVVAIDVRSR